MGMDLCMSMSMELGMGMGMGEVSTPKRYIIESNRTRSLKRQQNADWAWALTIAAVVVPVASFCGKST